MKWKVSLYTSLSLIFSFESMAASVCYSEQKYPAVHILGLNESKQPLLALVGKYADMKKKHIPFLEQTDKGWIETTDTKCKPFWSCMNRSKNCHVKIPEIKLTIAEVMKYRSLKQKPEWVQQDISACVKDGDDVYFGIAFYQGEGGDGLGGIGKYNIKTRKVEVRRLAPLINTSVKALAYDGEELWISAASDYECIGDVPEVPLMKYNWKNDAITNEYALDTFCGFNTHDIFYSNDTIYVGSDMGFSVSKRKPIQFGEDILGYEWGKFIHYIPDLKLPEKMERLSCGSLYEELIKSGPKEMDVQLLENLIKFKPEYIKNKLIRMNKRLNELPSSNR